MLKITSVRFSQQLVQLGTPQCGLHDLISNSLKAGISFRAADLFVQRPTLQCKQESKRRITRSISQKYLLQSIWIVSSFKSVPISSKMFTEHTSRIQVGNIIETSFNILKPTIYVPIPEDESWWIFQLICFETTRHALRILNTCVVQQHPVDLAGRTVCACHLSVEVDATSSTKARLMRRWKDFGEASPPDMGVS